MEWLDNAVGMIDNLEHSIRTKAKDLVLTQDEHDQLITVCEYLHDAKDELIMFGADVDGT
jgi:hypothetical protein